MLEESKGVRLLPELTTKCDIDKVIAIERGIIEMLTEKQGFERPVMNIVKGRDPSKLSEFLPFPQPGSSGFWLHRAQEVLRNGDTVMFTDTESGLSDERLAMLERQLVELETEAAKPKRMSHVAPIPIPKWIDSIREVNPEMVSDTANIDEARWKELLPTLWQPRKGGKYAKGKAAKRKLRHRKGK